MNVVETALPSVLILEPRVHGDECGFFLESFQRERCAEAGKEVSLPAGVYHLGSGPDTTWHAFAKLIFEQARAHRLLDRAPHVRAISTAEYPTPAMRPLRAVLAPSKDLLDALGGLPDWRTGLVHAISKLSKQL